MAALETGISLSLKHGNDILNVQGTSWAEFAEILATAQEDVQLARFFDAHAPATAQKVLQPTPPAKQTTVEEAIVKSLHDVPQALLMAAQKKLEKQGKPTPLEDLAKLTLDEVKSLIQKSVA